MTTQSKTFDCVEMKNRIQAEILADYESRPGEFRSFVDYVRAVSTDSDYVRQMHRRFGEPSRSLRPVPLR